MNLADIPKEKLSPMMQQYAATKEKYNDCILFFRLGDFYEMFFEDAILVSRELELTLTGKGMRSGRTCADVRRAVPQRRTLSETPGGQGL